MPRNSVREIGEAIALLGVVASLVFVGLELRENRISARAAAYQELGIAVADNWMARADNRELNDLILVAASGDAEAWAALDASDVYVIRSYTLANLRLFETVYLQVDQKLLEADALDTLGWNNFLNSGFLLRMWPEVKSMVTPAFADFLESQRPALARSGA